MPDHLIQTFDFYMKKTAFLNKTKMKYLSFFAICALGVLLILTLFIFKPKYAVAQDYPVQGFDISHHQGSIDWSKISPKKYQFVYIKATEGGDYKDDRFQDYWLEARERGIRVGAYHFYRLCKDGASQAQNFIETVPIKNNSLAPVIDLEYDANCINQYTKEQLLQQIQIMHDRLQQHYGKAPIFYTSKIFYNMVLTGNFQKTPIWIREYKDSPNLKDKRPWMIWQYSNTGKIQGIEKAVDLNRYAGSEQDWKQYLKSIGLE